MGVVLWILCFGKHLVFPTLTCNGHLELTNFDLWRCNKCF